MSWIPLKMTDKHGLKFKELGDSLDYAGLQEELTQIDKTTEEQAFGTIMRLRKAVEAKA